MLWWKNNINIYNLVYITVKLPSRLDYYLQTAEQPVSMHRTYLMALSTAIYIWIMKYSVLHLTIMIALTPSRGERFHVGQVLVESILYRWSAWS